MLLETLLKNTEALVNSTVIKFNNIARENETLESLQNADIYISAMQKTDRFDLYSEFDVEVLIRAGISLIYSAVPPANILADLSLVPDELYDFANNPSTIPKQYQNAVLEENRKFIIENYVELNNYYRMLHGLPNIESDDTTFIRLTDDQKVASHVTSSNYIHELSLLDIYKIKEAGILDTIISEHPDDKYLNYLGESRVDIVTARQASGFTILRISNVGIPDDFYKTFLDIYEQNREYFMVAIYNTDYAKTYNLYDNFMGMCIMFMTIQRVVSNSFKFGINREFYDWDFIQNIYKSYNVPFVESLPIEYHVTILKNLNNLLRYKSTDKVLFDICSLLGYERMDIFRYYLVKNHKLDNDGKPLFYYRHARNESNELLYDEGGNPIYEEDKERMYELYFQAVNIRDRNVALALQDIDKRLDYEEVTMNDPYWWEDTNLEALKYESPYNYSETKYISLHVMYKMTKMLFEITYAFRMILDKKDEIELYTLPLPRIDASMSFKLFDVVVFLVCLTCKVNGFDDYTITTASRISHIYGFNFNDDEVEHIRSIFADNADIVDPDIVAYFNDITINSAAEVNDLYAHIRAYNDLIIKKMSESQDIREYRMYKDIFTISIAEETQTDMFTIIEDGVPRVATSYLEYLQYAQPLLADTVVNTAVDDVSQLVNHVTTNINKFMEDLKYLFIINETNNPIFKSVMELMKFFKSYTTDLSGYNIIYLFDSKYYNMIKMIDDVKAANGVIYSNESLCEQYGDNIVSLAANLNGMKNIIKFNETYDNFIKIELDDRLILEDRLMTALTNYDISDDLDLIDKYDIIKRNIVKEFMMLYDTAFTHVGHSLIDNFDMDEILKSISSIIYHRCNLVMTDEFKLNHGDILVKLQSILLDSIKSVLISINISHELHVDERVDISAVIQSLDSLNYAYSSDILSAESTIKNNEEVKLRDKLTIFYE